MRVRTRTAELLRSRLRTEQLERRLPSLVAAMVRDGGTVWWDAAGEVGGHPPTDDTQYRIGSITKTLVAVEILRLRDEGELDLADPVTRHVPEAPVGSATLAQALSHTSGLQAETDGPWWERSPGTTWPRLAAAHDERAVLRHPHGRRFHYSNIGYAVLGETVARLRGAPWDEVLRTGLLQPLGMDRTTTRPVAPAAPGLAVHPFADVVLPEPEHDAEAMAPAGQLWCSVRDLATWATFLAGRTEGLLDPATLREMARPIAVDDRPGQPWTCAHGLGVQVFNLDGRRAIGHGGSMPGFLAAVRVDEEDGDGVVVMTNTTQGLRPALVDDLLRILREEEPRPVEPWSPAAPAPEVLELLGPWFWGPLPLVLRAEGAERLELRPVEGPGRASRFVPDGEGRWRGLDGYFAGETLRVVSHDDGSLAHLDLASFVLTRTPYEPDADVPGGVDPAGWR